MDKATEEHFRSIGPFEVMRSVARGDLGSGPQSSRWQEAEAWAKAEIAALEAASSAARDKREEETLSIARSALSNSRRANQIAIAAAILAAAATIIAAIIAVMYVPQK